MVDPLIEELKSLGLHLSADPPSSSSEDVSRLSRYVSGGTFLLDLPPVPRAVWGRGPEVIWPRGEALVITGPTGIGKTTLVGNLIKARIGLQATVLGYPVEATASKVLCITADRPTQARYALGRMVDPADRGLLDERLVFWPRLLDHDLSTDTELLLKMCRDVDADTLVIDAYKDVSKNLSEEQGGSSLDRSIKRVSGEGIEVVGLHHQRKMQGGVRPKSIDDVYGSMHITAGAGGVILLWGTPGDLVVDFSMLKKPHDEVGPLTIAQDATTGAFTVLAKPDPVAIVAAGPPSGLSIADIASALFGKTTPLTEAERKKTERLVTKAVDRGELIKEPAKRGGTSGTSPALYRVP